MRAQHCWTGFDPRTGKYVALPPHAWKKRIRQLRRQGASLTQRGPTLSVFLNGELQLELDKKCWTH